MQRLKIVSIGPGIALETGLRINDILDTLDGTPLDTSETLAKLMHGFRGQLKELCVIRGYEKLKYQLRCGVLGLSAEQVQVDSDYLNLVNGLPLSTTHEIPGFRVTQSLDVIGAECAFGMSIFKDALVGLSDLFGGRSGSTQKVLREARQKCFFELRREAVDLGANAVVGVCLNYSEFSGQGKSMIFLVASGTAVIVEPL